MLCDQPLRLLACVLQGEERVAAQTDAPAICAEDERKGLRAALTYSQVEAGDATCGVPVGSLRACWLEATHEDISQMRPDWRPLPSASQRYTDSGTRPLRVSSLGSFSAAARS